MPEMSGKCKSNPIKTNNLIYIMIFNPPYSRPLFDGNNRKSEVLKILNSP